MEFMAVPHYDKPLDRRGVEVSRVVVLVLALVPVLCCAQLAEEGTEVTRGGGQGVARNQ